MLIQKLRLKRGWSQEQLAELSGLSVRTVQRIEGGKPASAETLKSLASVFEIEFSDLNSVPSMTTPAHAETEERLALAHVRRVKAFYIHVAQYVIVITMLFVINFVVTPHRIWAYWPALGWGVGLLAHAASTFHFIPFLGADWEKRQVEKRLGRPL